MPDLPKKIHVSPVVFDVEIDDKIMLQENRLIGEANYNDGKIRLVSHTPPLIKAQTLFHEIQHVINEYNGDGGSDSPLDSEAVVHRLASSWLSVLIDSPGLLEYLTEIRKLKHEG